MIVRAENRWAGRLQEHWTSPVAVCEEYCIMRAIVPVWIGRAGVRGRASVFDRKGL